MRSMIMRNKPQFTQTTFALETGLGLLCSNYRYGWNLIVDNKPEYSFFSVIIAHFRQLHNSFSGSFHSRFKRSADIGTGTR